MIMHPFWRPFQPDVQPGSSLAADSVRQRALISSVPILICTSIIRHPSRKSSLDDRSSYLFIDGNSVSSVDDTKSGADNGQRNANGAR